MMKYCQSCLLPDTRPNLELDSDGICFACKSHGTKDSIDWEKREKDFVKVIDHARENSRGYDCIIPVSGGKDSTWQVIKCLEYGLKPLCVTWAPGSRTEIGRLNLQNMIHLGVDHIDFSISPTVEKKFLYQALTKVGMPGLPMHMAIFNVPIIVAVNFNVPLVIYGENSSFEYGGSDEATKGFEMTPAWLKKFGVTDGTTARDWICDDLTEKDLTPYIGPSEEKLKEAGIKAIFLGQYFHWDPVMTYEVAKKHGFKSSKDGAKTGVYDFADIDDEFISVHHYIKWYKFGFTRTWDNLAQEIRNGRLTREKAMEILTEKGDETPVGDIQKFCEYIGIRYDEFFEIIEKFRNHDIWKKDNDTWKIPGFLIKDYKW